MTVDELAAIAAEAIRDALAVETTGEEVNEVDEGRKAA